MTKSGKAGTVPKAVQSPFSLPNKELLERLGRIAQAIGARSFLVGGPVRDIMLQQAFGAGRDSESPEGDSPRRADARRNQGQSPRFRPGADIDIAVEDKSREFGNAVARDFGGRFVYHSRFLTGTVSFPEPQASSLKLQAGESELALLASRFSPRAHIDLSQTRTEVYPRPAVLPQVKPASIKDDLARRDFTINAMALELTPGALGTFIDPHGGTADMENGIVRVLHDRSFTDDPTRIFRCLRFATRFGFKIEPRTLHLLRRAVGQRLPALLTPERILHELRCICAEPLATAIVRRVVRERVLEAAWRWRPPSDFLPRFARLARVGMVRNLWGQSPDFAALSLLFVFWLSTLPVTDRFPIRKEEREAAQAIAEFGRLKRKLKRKLKPSAVFRLLCPLPKQALEVLAAVETGKVRKNLRLYLDELRHVRVSTTGNELRALGIAPGPAYRAILDKLLFARLDGKIRTVADEKDLLRRLAGRARRS